MGERVTFIGFLLQGVLDEGKRGLEMKTITNSTSPHHDVVWAAISSGMLIVITLWRFLRYSVGDFRSLLLGSVVFLATIMYWGAGIAVQRVSKFRLLMKGATFLVSVALVAYITCYENMVIRSMCELFMGIMIAESAICSNLMPTNQLDDNDE